jgi:LysM repeat protein
VNGMDITLGSTITLTNSTANTLTITVHDGQMRIPAAGVTVNASQSVDVALNAVSVASTISSPRPATADELSVGGTVTAAYDALDGTAPPAATTTYTVQPGDTLFSIARNNGTCVSELMQANNIPESQINTIFVGQVLTIPDGSTCTGGVMDVRPVATTAPPAQTEEATQEVTQDVTQEATADMTPDVSPEATDDVTGQFNDQFGTPEPLVTEDSPVQQAP